MTRLDALRAACATEADRTAMTGLRLAADIIGLDVDGQVIALAKSGAIDDSKRKTLIELSLAGKHIELEIDIVAYVQAPGVRNRNCIRFRAGRLQAIARTGVGSTFLRNHEQREVMSAGGTVTASKLVKKGDVREVHQTVRLTVPWAVRAALQGVLGKFSIGWWPTAPVHCSLCDAPVQECLWKLGHWRGTEHDGQVVEFVFQDAELIETSAVNVPAVPETRMRGIRADADKAVDELFALGADSPPEHGGMPVADTHNALERINTRLGLQAEASEAAALAALSSLQNACELARSQLADVTVERDAATAERDKLRARLDALESERQTERADAFVQRAVEAGKCALNSATAAYFRGLYVQDEAAAEETLAAAPRVTPVGQPMQSERPDAAVSRPGAPDYKVLATQLSADDIDTAKLAGVEAADYVRANYAELAATYNWPAQA